MIIRYYCIFRLRHKLINKDGARVLLPAISADCYLESLRNFYIPILIYVFIFQSFGTIKYFNTNILYQIFCNKITHVNLQHKKTNLRDDVVLKNWV